MRISMEHVYCVSRNDQVWDNNAWKSGENSYILCSSYLRISLLISLRDNISDYNVMKTDIYMN